MWKAERRDSSRRDNPGTDRARFAERSSGFYRQTAHDGHLSPFEHVSFTSGIEGVSRALLAQTTRHRIASFSVQSQRYVAADSTKCVVPPSIAAPGDTCVDEYRDWLDKLGENKKEDARFVLPNGCTARMIVAMNARELLHAGLPTASPSVDFAKLRCNRARHLL